MRTILVALFLLLSTVCSAEDSKWKWTKTDTAVQTGVVALLVVDWGQTFDVSASKTETSYVAWGQPGAKESTKTAARYDHAEFNPILGEHPTRGRINTYFISVIVGHTAIARLLPRPYRRIWQALWIAGEGAVVANNFSVGVKVDF